MIRKRICILTIEQIYLLQQLHQNQQCKNHYLYSYLDLNYKYNEYNWLYTITAGNFNIPISIKCNTDISLWTNNSSGLNEENIISYLITKDTYVIWHCMLYTELTTPGSKTRPISHTTCVIFSLHGWVKFLIKNMYILL